ncbi:alpha-hydroxy acid oxidase [Ramlibacter sp.]|uniref:alpha-hydroxy acid oxidase n=1 Tax=Ramlibacter sp. TaxID=1917967 RepID=UPI0035AF8D4A
MPLATVSDWRAAARRRLPRFAFDYLEGGAEDGRAMARNESAFGRIGFVPRSLVDVANVDMTATLYGQQLAMPVAVGPTGLNGLYRPQAEEKLARAAGRAGLPFVLSTASTSRIESVRAAACGPLWLQLYVQNDRRIAERWMAKARSCGFSVLLITVDTPVAGTRDHYRRNGFTLPLRWTPRLLLDIARHPRWCLSTGVHGMPQMVNLADCSEQRADITTQAATMAQEMNRSLTWTDLAWLRRHWNGPVVVKGIGCVDDARLARQYGADGIVLSNHGGRQLEDAPTAIELLAAVVDAVGGSMPVLMDGGIRRGSAVAKAVALGASGVLLGRAPLYGLAAGDEAGAEEVLAILRRELEVTLRLLGRPVLRELGRSDVTRI